MKIIMKARIFSTLSLLFISVIVWSQDATGFENKLNNPLSISELLESGMLDEYFDSISQAHSGKIITGYTHTIYAEPTPFIELEYSFNDENFKSITCNKNGLFYIPIENNNDKDLRLRSADKAYKQFDTIIKSPTKEQKHIPIIVSPRFKIVLRGRLIIGSLPSEGISVTIRHNQDTFRLKTLGCYTDDEDYWNCLYTGMFKQVINFDNPMDSIFLSFSKPGFKTSESSMLVSEYTGEVIETKLEYAKYLPKFPKHNLSFKYAPQFTDAWSVALSYTYLPKFNTFKRLGFGLEAAMLIKEVDDEINTYPDVNSLPDTSYTVLKSTSSYTVGMFMPYVSFWLTKPERRRYSIYTGIAFPYTIPSNKIYIQPYIGGRMYIDINKALLVEARYLFYDMDIDNYEFNSYGNAISNKINQDYSQLMVNVGLQISF